MKLNFNIVKTALIIVLFIFLLMDSKSNIDYTLYSMNIVVWIIVLMMELVAGEYKSSDN